MSPTIKTLHEISYIMECLLMNYTGETKSELWALANLIESDDSYAIDNRIEVVSQLRECQSYYINSQWAKGSHILNNVSRELWRKVFHS